MYKYVYIDTYLVLPLFVLVTRTGSRGFMLRNVNKTIYIYIYYLIRVHDVIKLGLLLLFGMRDP